MTIERFRAAVSVAPFRPFRLVTADGRTYRVSHPDFVLLSPKAERTFVIYSQDSDDPEAYVVLDLLLISAIEFGSEDQARRMAG